MKAVKKLSRKRHKVNSFHFINIVKDPERKFFKEKKL